MTGEPLTPQLLLDAYRHGLFPMAQSHNSSEIHWFCPEQRAVLPLDGFRCPRSLRQTIAKNIFDIRIDTAFEKVIRACAKPRAQEPDTWINSKIIHAYTDLHLSGYAHSVEAWRDDKLVGGLYGVVIGSAFCGESMFHLADQGGTDASKVCLVHLVEHLKAQRFVLLDVQINSEHMMQFGTIEIPGSEYLSQLHAAMQTNATW